LLMDCCHQSGSCQLGNTHSWVLISRYFRVGGDWA